MVASRRATTDSYVETSVGTPTTSSPSARSSSTVFASGSGWTSARTTFMPMAPNASPSARPIPPAPPVTTATLPASCCTSVGPDRGEVVVALMHVGRDPVGGQRRDDLAGLDAGAFRELDAAQLPHRQISDGVEPGLAQDALAVDPPQPSSLLIAMTVDE